MTVELRAIGVARTPYTDWAPHQPPLRDAPRGAFRVVVDGEHLAGLEALDRFTHVILLSHLDQARSGPGGLVSPPWAAGRTVGVFASRSPHRPSPIGLTVVRLVEVEGCTLHTAPLDLLDGTPILDIKPYIGAVDHASGANDGWIEDLDDYVHVLQHLRGAPHEHDHEHQHADGHEHDHRHTHEHGREDADRHGHGGGVHDHGDAGRARDHGGGAHDHDDGPEGA